MPKNLYKIGEVANLLATSVRAIRYYEDEGLIKPFRTKGGTRLYSNTHIKRLKSILFLIDVGFSIESIRKIATEREGCSTGNESSNKVSNLLDEIISSIDAQIKALNALKKTVVHAKEAIGSCSDCSNHPSTRGCPNCPVRLKRDQNILLNLIWDTEY